MSFRITQAGGGVGFRNSANEQVVGSLLQCADASMSFEVYSPYAVARVGEELTDVTLEYFGSPAYKGNAIVTAVVATSSVQVITVRTLGSWDPPIETPNRAGLDATRALIENWRGEHDLQPAYQLAVSNIRSFLLGLKGMLTPIDVALGSNSDISERTEKLTEDLYAIVWPRLKALFNQFEAAALEVPPAMVEAHRAFAQRELHPLILCAPLVHRSFTKPLGYAGDYEMVNMLLRNRMEGPSTYARIVNAYFLRMDVAEGHRNRITKLVDMLQVRSRQTLPQDRPLKVLNLGCGPADEVCRFIRRDAFSTHCEFTLIDFNQRTLEYAMERVREACEESGRSPAVTFIHKSVNDLLKEAVRDRHSMASAGYDVVYCAGLFDYLSDRVCNRLLRLFANWTLPGGLVVATNVHPRHTAHATLDDLAEWHLILRDEAAMLALAPMGVGTPSVCTEPAGANVFVEIQMPGIASEDRNGGSIGSEHRGAACGGLSGL